MSELLALAERCEAATGPDRELDLKVAQMRPINPVPASAKYEPRYGGQEGCAWTVNGLGMNVPHYTSSLDAAMSLVPEGWPWRMWKATDVWHGADVFPHGEAISCCRSHASTPALSFCAAALRALAAQEPSS